MKLLHLGCGNIRPGDPWVNMDIWGPTAHNAINWDMTVHPWPFGQGEFDGILAMHVFEHFDAHQLQNILQECYRILKPEGVLRCGVPDASHFRRVYKEDTTENSVRLFGEHNSHPGYETFMGWALFLYQDHRQVFTEDSLWCTLVNREYPPKTTSFLPENVVRSEFKTTTRHGHRAAETICYLDNRPGFTLYMEAFK